MDQRMVGETDVSNLLGTDICILLCGFQPKCD